MRLKFTTQLVDSTPCKAAKANTMNTAAVLDMSQFVDSISMGAIFDSADAGEPSRQDYNGKEVSLDLADAGCLFTLLGKLGHLAQAQSNALRRVAV